MAKDGTNRGGFRAGAGRKKKPLGERLSEGESGTAVKFTKDMEKYARKPQLHDFYDEEELLLTAEIHDKTWKWLKDRSCASLINPQLLEQYAVNMARWIDCERLVNEEGYSIPGPANKGTIMNPTVKVALEYSHHANQLWAQIWQIVKENCTEVITGSTPNDDFLEAAMQEFEAES